MSVFQLTDRSKRPNLILAAMNLVILETPLIFKKILWSVRWNILLRSWSLLNFCLQWTSILWLAEYVTKGVVVAGEKSLVCRSPWSWLNGSIARRNALWALVHIRLRPCQFGGLLKAYLTPKEKIIAPTQPSTLEAVYLIEDGRIQETYKCI